MLTAALLTLAAHPLQLLLAAILGGHVLLDARRRAVRIQRSVPRPEVAAIVSRILADGPRAA